MKRAKRLLSLLLVILTLALCFAPAAEAASSTASSSPLPIIYIKGNANAKLYNKKGERIWPLKTGLKKVIADNKSDIVKAAVLSYTTSNWNYLSDELYETVAPLFSELLLDNNGNNQNGVYVEKNVINTNKSGKYTVEEYCFKYDMRLDPLDVADNLRAYIKKVLDATGKKKVNLISRCMGASFMSAYLYKYRSNPLVNSAIYYSPGVNGVLIEEAPFCGELSLSSESMSQYVSSTGEESLSSMFQVLTNIFGSKAISSEVNSVMSQAMPIILPRILRACYANFPSYWSLLDDEHYSLAKSYIFNSASLRSKYAKFIKKIDNYHKKVQRNLPDTLTYLKNVKGVNINVITKYNREFDPIYDGSEADGDEWIEANSQSFGATVAEHGTKLSKSYCNALADAGLGNYISSDRKIDASTCLFPDSTWFVKNCKHSNWGTFVSPLVYAIFSRSTQVTVRTYSNFPQFLKISNGKLVNIYDYESMKNPPVEGVKCSPSQYEYNGNKKTPTVIVTAVNGDKLKKGKDYKLTYQEERTSIGKHFVKVTFMGDYAKTPAKKAYFKILPSDVSDLSVSSVGVDSATLKWTASKGATSYNIYLYSKKASKWKRIGSTTVTSFRATGLPKGANVKLAVKGVRKVDSVAFESPDFIKAAVNLKLPAPVVKAKGGEKKVSLTWTKNSNASSYQIYRSNAKNGVYTKIATVKTGSYTNSSLNSRRTYYFKVRSVKTVDGKENVSSFSSIVSARTS